MQVDYCVNVKFFSSVGVEVDLFYVVWREIFS